MQWVRQILGKHEEDLKEIHSPSPETVENLISRVSETGFKKEEAADIPTLEDSGVIRKDAEASGSSTFKEERKQDEEKPKEEESQQDSKCPYVLKRNIVASLQEIRKFAEEHNLASAMIKALLTLLAEMAINALKGKVSGTALAVLLNAMNFDKAKSEAYREGEIAGRNAQIMEKHFPSTDDGLPHLSSGAKNTGSTSDIFSIAREA